MAHETNSCSSCKSDFAHVPKYLSHFAHHLSLSIGEVSNKQLMLKQQYDRPAQSGQNAHDSVIAPENTSC